jgi:ribosomal protein S18 acetylase RimI-like enzyme
MEEDGAMSAAFRVRAAEPCDELGLHAIDLAVARDGRGVLVSFGDVKARGPNAGPFIAQTLDPATRDDCVLFVAESAGEVVADANVQRIRTTFTRHVGIFGIEVHPSAQRRGIGRALLRACVDWSRAHGIERLELYVRADNTRAIALYESEGFVLESRRTRFTRLPDGSYVDDLGYVRFLSRA